MTIRMKSDLQQPHLCWLSGCISNTLLVPMSFFSLGLDSLRCRVGHFSFRTGNQCWSNIKSTSLCWWHSKLFRLCPYHPFDGYLVGRNRKLLHDMPEGHAIFGRPRINNLASRYVRVWDLILAQQYLSRPGAWSVKRTRETLLCTTLLELSHTKVWPTGHFRQPRIYSTHCVWCHCGAGLKVMLFWG